MIRPIYLLPAAVLGLVVLNAFFGHLYGTYGAEVARYSVYVHLGDGWESRPGNMIFEVIRVRDVPAEGDSGPVPYNPNLPGEQHGLEYVELRHGFAGCDPGRQPEPYRLAADSARAWLEYMQGIRLDPDPYAAKLPDMAGGAHTGARHFAQFIPACASRAGELNYSVSISGGAHFDAYFVDSESELAEYLESGRVTHYEGCAAQGMQSYGGTCYVDPGSGLLLLVPDALGEPLTRVKISIYG